MVLVHNTRMVNPGAHCGPGACSGSLNPFSLGVDVLDSGATGDKHIRGKTGQQTCAQEAGKGVKGD
jgi:hypothetical protein